ncbi:RNA polymerase sigma factor [Solicola sp. PLA-1-18]|uniref:RNA polymerase sigma factor n=1 Tax=Solicola sp. PLA-1-18 TaxID=3380532 RepID=UPI003B799F31
MTSGAPLDVTAAFDAHAKPLLGFLVNALGDHARAEDLLQETFVRAWRRRDTYDATVASERTWLFAISRNLVVDDVRAHARRPRTVPELDDSAPVDLTLQATRRRVDEDVEVRLQLLEALATLSDEHRQVVAVVHLQGGTYADLSDRTGTSVATLRSRMHYGLRAMRAALETNGWRTP